MNRELELKLKEEFSPIYDHLEFGFECDDGWYDLLYNLSKAIYFKAEEVGLDLARSGAPGSDHSLCFYVKQVKEKHGILAFYTSCHMDGIQCLVDLAEKESETTCEVCGEPGKMSDGPWFSVRCDQCAEK